MSASTTTGRSSRGAGKRLSEAEREARRAADREFVQQAVEALRSTEGWQRWLVTRHHFHAYCLLISGAAVAKRAGNDREHRRHVIDISVPSIASSG